MNLPLGTQGKELTVDNRPVWFSDIVTELATLKDQVEKLETALANAKQDRQTMVDRLNEFTLNPLGRADIPIFGAQTEATLEKYSLEQIIQIHEYMFRCSVACMKIKQGFSDSKTIELRRTERVKEGKSLAKAESERKSSVGRRALSDEAKMIRGLWKACGHLLSREQLSNTVKAQFPNMTSEQIGASLDELNSASVR